MGCCGVVIGVFVAGIGPIARIAPELSCRHFKADRRQQLRRENVRVKRREAVGLESEVTFFGVAQLQRSDLQNAVVCHSDLHRLIDGKHIRCLLRRKPRRKQNANHRFGRQEPHQQTQLHRSTLGPEE